MQPLEIGQVNDQGGKARKVRWDDATGEVWVELTGKTPSKYIKAGSAKTKLAALDRARQAVRR